MYSRTDFIANQNIYVQQPAQREQSNQYGARSVKYCTAQTKYQSAKLCWPKGREGGAWNNLHRDGIMDASFAKRQREFVVGGCLLDQCGFVDHPSVHRRDRPFVWPLEMSLMMSSRCV